MQAHLGTEVQRADGLSQEVARLRASALSMPRDHKVSNLSSMSVFWPVSTLMSSLFSRLQSREELCLHRESCDDPCASKHGDCAQKAFLTGHLQLYPHVQKLSCSLIRRGLR